MFKNLFRATFAITVLCLLALGQSIRAQDEASSKEAPNEKPLRVVTGRVINEAGKPIRLASVEWGHFQATRDRRQVIRTGTNGNFRLETREVEQDFRLGVSAVGYAPAWRDGLIPPKANGKPMEIDFTLRKPMSLSGLIVDQSGKPVEGVVVSAKSPTTGGYTSFSSPTPSYPFPGPSRESKTDSEGKFFIRYLPSTFAMSDEIEKGYPFDVDVMSGKNHVWSGRLYSKEDNRVSVNRAYVDKNAQSFGTIRGKVLDANTEEPIDHFKVVIRHNEGMIPFKDSTGGFELKKLRAGRRVQFFVYANGYSPFVARPTIQPGQPVFIECNLSPKQGIKGIVIDKSGVPIENAEVVAGVEDSPHRQDTFFWGSFDRLVDGYMGLDNVQRMRTSDDGRFEFSRPDSIPLIAVKAPGYARKLVSVKMHDALLDEDGILQIQLGAGARLKGTVKLNGVSDPTMRVQLYRTSNWNLDFGSQTVDESCNFEFSELEPDTYKITVYADRSGGPLLTRNVDLKAGETFECSLDSPGGPFTLSGKVAPFAYVFASQKKPVGKEGSEFQGAGTFAGPEGEFTIPSLWGGDYEVSANVYSALSGYHQPQSVKKVSIFKDHILDFSQTRNPVLQLR